MPKRPRLLLVSPLPPPPGGIATWTRAVMNSSLADRFQIEVFNTAAAEKNTVSAVSRFRLSRALDAALRIVRLRRMLRALHPEIVHVNTSFHWGLLRDVVFCELARVVGAKAVLHFHGGDFPQSHLATPTSLRRWLDIRLSRVDRLIAVDRHTERFLTARFGTDRVRYIPNFVDAGEFACEADGRHRDALTVPEVLFVGWIVASKGVAELLAAAEQLPEVRFTLAGPQDPEFVTSLSTSLARVGERVRLLGPVSREQVFRLYSEADVFVLPTWREGFPNVVLEAMAAGLPIVATPVGAIPDAIRDGEEGLLVPARDAAALERAINLLCANPSLRRKMGSAARERARTTFDTAIVLEQLESLYHSVLGPDATPSLCEGNGAGAG